MLSFCNNNDQLIILSPLEQFKVLNTFIFTNAQFFLVGTIGVLCYTCFTYTQRFSWIYNRTRSFTCVTRLLHKELVSLVFLSVRRQISQVYLPWLYRSVLFLWLVLI